MTERHTDVRTMLRAFDTPDFPYRTFGAATARLPRQEARPADVPPAAAAAPPSPMRRDDTSRPVRAVASEPAKVVLWTPQPAAGPAARHDAAVRPARKAADDARLSDVFAILAKT